MKKLVNYIILIILTMMIFFFAYNYKISANPNTFYQVYINGEVVGVIRSKDELDNYIDKQNKKFKKQFNVKKIYAPNSLEVKKIDTYNDKISEVKDVYKIISEKEPFTIKGYQFLIKKESEEENVIIYTLNKKIFKDAVTSTIKTFVNEDKYKDYLDDAQDVITETGTLLENVYIAEDITVKKVNIPVTETVYINAQTLAKYLVFGENAETNTYVVKVGDTIEDVAFNNKISVQEFLISNPSFTSSKNLLFPGQEVNIGVTDPQISVVEEDYTVQDQEIAFATELRYDETRVIGDDEVIQTGENGSMRVTQRIRYTNGIISYVEPISKEELKPTINQIILKGDKYIPNVGSTKNWLWPTKVPYTISSDYIYRINPVSGQRELHAAIDVAGTGYGSPIYAVTNGVVSEVATRYQDGKYVCINHNNGYYTCYAHMSKQNVKVGQTVARGDVIGYVGQSGWATGPHLHFEVWVGGAPWIGGRRINPWSMYR